MITITAEQKKKMEEQALKGGSGESCGILAGKKKGKCSLVSLVIPMTNVSDDPEHCYMMDPKEQLKTLKKLREKGLEMVGIYHSHPFSEAMPSKKDVELAFYSDVSYVIISLSDKRTPEMRAFRITDGKITEEGINIE